MQSIEMVLSIIFASSDYVPVPPSRSGLVLQDRLKSFSSVQATSLHVCASITHLDGD